MLQLTDLREGDVQFIAANMRVADVQELEALGRAPLHALSDALKLGGARGVCRKPDGEPICIYGLVEREAGVGVPWMLGTPAVQQYRKSFIECSRRVVADMVEQYPLLINIVDSRNVVSHAYLRRLGFEIDTRNPVTPPSGVPFYVFKHHGRLGR